MDEKYYIWLNLKCVRFKKSTYWYWYTNMGKIQRRRPRRGSLQYWPRKRARRECPIIKNWPIAKDTKLSGIIGYKAGMSKVSIIDNRKSSPTKGEELSRAVTIVEVPPVKVFGIRAYSKTGDGLKCIGEAWDSKLSKELGRKIVLPKKSKSKISDLEKDVENFSQIRLLVHTQPNLTSIGKKKPEVIEIPIGGSDIKESFEAAKNLIGTEVKISDVFNEGKYIDVHAVTKGKGFQGVIKRFGVKRKKHKSEKGVRRVGTLGNWSAITWRVPHPGQMGYHLRTDKNKFLLKISNPKEEKIVPSGGFLHYGSVKNDYILLDGSIPGPKKRAIVLTASRTSPSKGLTKVPEIVYHDLKSQQG